MGLLAWNWALLLGSCALTVEGTAQGALKLDNYTFSKVTSLPGWSFLVKFDQSYAYGDLREKFKLSKEDFPAYFLFNEANSEGLRYSGSVKADLLANWLRRQQVKIPSIGTIEEFDELAKKFMKESFSDAVLAEAKKLAEGQFSSDRKAAIYVKIMEKIKEKGEDYVSSELKRVSKIAEGKVAPGKKAELEDKIKVLGVFAEKPSKDEL
eukprot:gb/GFBE01029953.1/.p1 GENE.gb/GFBE01029953.1/~~gb/GFBE01029953.1/.p1  ORF type:complete len:209 (+),score=74.86 gb/GFBE01029953.1/:1-627(+)